MPRPRSVIRSPDIKFQRSVAKPAKSSRQSISAKKLKRQETLKAAVQKTKAAKARTTARNSTIQSIKLKAKALKLLSSKKSSRLTKKQRKQSTVSKTLKKSRKKNKTSNQRVQEAKKVLKVKSEQRKSSILQRKEQRLEDLRFTAIAQMQIKRIQTTGRRLQLDIEASQKTIKSDRGVSELDITGVSNVKSLKERAKPVSNEPVRTIDANTKKGVIEQKQAALSKTSSETGPIKSIADKDAQNALVVKEKGNAVIRDQVPVKATMDSLSGSINKNKSLVNPVSPARRVAVDKKVADAAEAMKTASNSDSARQIAANNKNASTLQRDSADLGRRETGSDAASHETIELNATRQRMETEGLKKAATNAKTEAVLTNLGAAKTKRATAESTMKTIKERNADLERIYGSTVKSRAKTEQSHAQNEVIIKDREGAELTSRNDMNNGTVIHKNNTNDVDTLTRQRDTLQIEQNILKNKVEQQRLDTQTLRPTISPEFVKKVDTKRELLQKIASLESQHSSAVRKLEATMAERNRISNVFKSGDNIVKGNNDKIAGLNKEISNNSVKKDRTADINAKYKEMERGFRNVVGKQTSNVRQKGNTLDSIISTEQIVTKAKPTSERPPPKVETTKAGIHDISIKKEIAQKAHSNRKSTKEDISVVGGKKDALEGRLSNEVSNSAAHGKNRANERRNADGAKENGDAAVRNRKATLEEIYGTGTRRNQRQLELKSKGYNSEGMAKVRKVTKDIADVDTNTRQIKQKAEDAENSLIGAKKRKADADAKRHSELENAKRFKEKEDAAAAAKKNVQDDKADAQKKAAEAIDGALGPATAKKNKAKNDMEGTQKSHDGIEGAHAGGVKKVKASEKDVADADANIKNGETNEADAANALRDSKKRNDLDKASEADLLVQRFKLRRDIKALEAKLKKAKSDAESDYPQSSEKRKKLQDREKELMAKIDEARARLKDIEDELIKIRANKEKVKKIKERKNDIDWDAEIVRLRKKNEDAIRKKREERERAEKLRRDYERFKDGTTRGRWRIALLGGILGGILGNIIPYIINTGLTPEAPIDPNAPGEDLPDNQGTPKRPGIRDPDKPDSPPDRPDKNLPRPGGNVQTCYNNICTVQNLFCKKGSSEYMRGCKEGTLAGTTDGKRDGTIDEKRYAAVILPLSSDEIARILKVDTSTFTEIQKEAFCKEIENELQGSGKTIDEIYALYPECKVSSKYETPYGPKPRKDPYGEKEPESDDTNTGDEKKQEGGAPNKHSSADYLLGYTEAYRDAYMLSYTNAWALSKLNRKRIVPIVLKPPTTTPINTGFSGPSGFSVPSGFSGPIAPIRRIIVKSKRAIEAEKIIRRLDSLLYSKLAESIYGRFDALRESALSVIAEEEALASLTQES